MLFRNIINRTTNDLHTLPITDIAKRILRNGMNSISTMVITNNEEVLEKIGTHIETEIVLGNEKNGRMAIDQEIG